MSRVKLILSGLVIMVLIALPGCNIYQHCVAFDNNLNYNVVLHPLGVDHDLYSFAFTKKTSLHQYKILAGETKKAFRTPYCDKSKWDAYVNGDTLTFLVFKEEVFRAAPNLDALLQGMDHEQSIKVTYKDLTENDCQLIITSKQP